MFVCVLYLGDLVLFYVCVFLSLVDLWSDSFAASRWEDLTAAAVFKTLLPLGCLLAPPPYATYQFIERETRRGKVSMYVRKYMN